MKVSTFVFIFVCKNLDRVVYYTYVDKHHNYYSINSE